MSFTSIIKMIFKRKILLLIIGIIIFIIPQIIDQYRYNYLNKDIIFKKKLIVRSISVDDISITCSKDKKYVIIIRKSMTDGFNIKLYKVD